MLTLRSIAALACLSGPALSAWTTEHVAPGEPGSSAQAASAATRHLLVSPDELRRLPTSGPAWENLLDACAHDTSQPDLSNQNDPTNVCVLAKALVAARTGDRRLRDDVLRALHNVIGTQEGGRTLALGRELGAYVIAADLIGLDGPQQAQFKRFLRDVRHENLGGRTLVSTHRDRPNNWGTHAGATRIAIARYLEDEDDLADAVHVLRGFLGDRSAHRGFTFGSDLSWHSDPGNPFGVNPPGSTIQGHDVDGVLPDDQRRAGPFAWPPPSTNYAWEALQGLLLQAVLLDRAGYDVWEWSDRALLRSVEWLYDVNGYPPEGDDEWQVWVMLRFYPGSDFALPAGAPRPGKGFGFTDFLYPH